MFRIEALDSIQKLTKSDQERNFIKNKLKMENFYEGVDVRLSSEDVHISIS